MRRALIIGGLKATSRRKLGSIQTRTFRAGEVVFREGEDPRDEAFLVHAGRIEVRKRVGGEERLLWTYGKGELLGELGLFAGGAPRSATAVAIEPATLLVIPAKRLPPWCAPTHPRGGHHQGPLREAARHRRLLVAEGERRGRPAGARHFLSCTSSRGADHG